MSYFHIWAFIFLLLIHLDIMGFIKSWKDSCNDMVITRYKILDSPSRAYHDVCVDNLTGHGLENNFFFGLSCKIDVLWRNSNQAWGSWCLTRKPRFPPRYYKVELSCGVSFLGDTNQLEKIIWTFKR